MTIANAAPPEGDAIVYCEGAFNTTYGKTAHGLVRFTRRYRVRGVVDSRYAGRDAGEVLDAVPNGIPVIGSLGEALRLCREQGAPASHMVIGLATDGGVLDDAGKKAVAEAISSGLHVDCGLHHFISEDPSLSAMAARHGVRLRDIRKPPDRHELHFFSGVIEAVRAFKVAVLGTDSAVGKRTTAWKIVEGVEHTGRSAELIGTGQTAWLQGATYSIVLDSLVNDFVSGEIEHAVWRAWTERRPDVIVLEGQGSLLNPAYPGGYELLAAGRPDVVVLQHAPARKVYDGFPDYPIHPLDHQIRAIEMISGKPVVAVTVNHEDIEKSAVPDICAQLSADTGLPVIDVLLDGPEPLIRALSKHFIDLEKS